MDIEYPRFGMIVVNGRSYEHDVILEHEQVRARDKTPSKSLKGRYGHTPLSIEEDIPWSASRLVIGSGYSGRLPVLPEIEEEAAIRGVELAIMPTAEAVDDLCHGDISQVNAVLHVTC